MKITLEEKDLALFRKAGSKGGKKTRKRGKKYYSEIAKEGWKKKKKEGEHVVAL